MRRLTLITSLLVSLVLTVGCTPRQKDVDTRIAVAEEMAAAAKAQADQSAIQADNALRAANEAKRSTQETSALMQLMLQNSGSGR